MIDFDALVMSVPRYTIVPLVGSMRRSTQRPAVDLPEPDSPTRPSDLPWWSVKEIPDTACTCATARPMTVPPFTGKFFTRSVTSRTGAPMGASGNGSSLSSVTSAVVKAVFPEPFASSRLGLREGVGQQPADAVRDPQDE